MNVVVNKDCIENLKKDGSPVVIAAALKESEAIVNACREHGIKALAFCDSEKEKMVTLFTV